MPTEQPEMHSPVTAGKITIVDPTVVRAMTDTFFELLPFRAVEKGNFSETDLAEGKQILAKLETLRVNTGRVWTDETLANAKISTIKTVAAQFGSKATKLNTMRTAISGKPVSAAPNRELKLIRARVELAEQILAE